ncbi:D-alanyl-D-alanine carboxypeptidase family protein [Candidatus Saccharibacteria bacterium]|nr:D-alanyl-D-alanine carboxypeptidase family protein [Candidatus Saccharibacteria bacterium]
MPRRKKLPKKYILIPIVSVLSALIIFLILFSILGPKNQTVPDTESDESTTATSSTPEQPEKVELPDIASSANIETKYNSTNCTTEWGNLMLINPNFQVDSNFIATRRTELINITATYGIREGNAGNGTPLLDPEAASHLNEMLNAYKSYNPGHEITTRSCFRSRGTSCGRLCVATGGSDHHTGLTCDLIDDSYGDSLDTSTYSNHPEWQWLRANSYKYGFIDRFPEAWAGGPMSQPAVINSEGSTGLFETWHYRYVGITAATEIATGKYNNGAYDSLEHYLKATGKIKNLTNMPESCK